MFSSETFLSQAVLDRVTEMRVDAPGYAYRVAQERPKREYLTRRGKLNILAADHPARRVTKVGVDSLAMANRRDYLSRIVRALMAPTVDGLMATMDLIEELLILDGLVRDARGPSLLHDKLLIASLNRGGLASTVWELDDPITGATPASCAVWRLDGAKLLLRIGDSDAGSLKTLLASAQAINECNAARLPMFLEPLPVMKTDAGWALQKDPGPLARIAGVASALGDSSRYLWLKLPYCPGYEVVARSTSLPILLLGGESTGDPRSFLHELQEGMRAGANVRGALVGRNVLYPGDRDPMAVAAAVGALIHEGISVEEAASRMNAEDDDLDVLTRYLG